MPKVGNKHFSYTKKGVAAAKKEAKKVGKSLVYDTTNPVPKPKPKPFKKGTKYKITKLGK